MRLNSDEVAQIRRLSSGQDVSPFPICKSDTDIDRSNRYDILLTASATAIIPD